MFIKMMKVKRFTHQSVWLYKCIFTFSKKFIVLLHVIIENMTLMKLEEIFPILLKGSEVEFLRWFRHLLSIIWDLIIELFSWHVLGTWSFISLIYVRSIPHEIVMMSFQWLNRAIWANACWKYTLNRHNRWAIPFAI